jgi:hypothetical protein
MNFDLEVFLASLRNGFGFTKTCELLGYDVKETSDHLQKNKLVLEECRAAVQMSFKALLAASNQHIAKRQFDRWKANNEYVRNYVTSINLWECFCKKSDISPKKVCEAVFIYKDLDEAATAMGMSKLEINQYIMENAYIGKYISENLFLSR